MNPLRFIVEPASLLMTWQPSDDSGKSRVRRVIAEVKPDELDSSIWHFRYLLGTPDFEAARAAGFEGHPAFKLNAATYSQGVRETLLRRLPPRRREDFAAFLTVHQLPDPFVGSDMALLGYTGAKLPSDGFSFVPVFGATNEPCEYILEIAGLRYVFAGELENVKVGDPVEFVPEPENPIDSGALAIYSRGHKLGYVNRAMLETFRRWLASGHLLGFVERKNGRPERPLIYVRVQAQCPTATV